MEKQKEIVSRIFQNKYNIPRSLIIDKEGQCSGQKEIKKYIHLCLNKKGELIQLSSYIKFKIKSLLTFKSLLKKPNHIKSGLL